ncbi:hypothetical protein [Novipirellula maiorica]|nr:hypothetical protein [Rhodopirellula maiorica]
MFPPLESQMPFTEQILGVVNSSDGHRVLLVLRERHAKPFELRTETFSSNVGWFTQQSLELTRLEFSGLKNVLGLPLARVCSQTLQDIQPADREESGQSILSFAAATKTA